MTFRYMALVLLLGVSGCNFATQSFNLGKLLLPGESLTTLSLGKKSDYEINETRYLWGVDDSDRGYTTTRKDTTTYSDWCYALDYRIGVLSNYPFGKGLEIGFLVEYPPQLATWTGPPLLQFDGRFGLPMRPFRRSIYHHNIDLGWIVGGWVNNSWFCEYAGGFEFGRIIPYCNVRVTRTATDFFDQVGWVDGDSSVTNYSRGWNFRTCAGVSLQLPRMPVLPDYLVPEIAVYFPNATLPSLGISWHIGARWLYGF